MNGKNYLIALSAFIPFGPARLGVLLSYFKDPAKIWRLTAEELLEVGLSKRLVNEFLAFRSGFNIEDYLERLKRFSLRCLVKGEKDYPSNLAEIDSAPWVLYVWGDFKERDKDAVAVVGSRKMSAYGREVTEKFSFELAEAGVTIISGLARGIDTVSHQASLAAGGRTIAVVGSGLDVIYPPENRALALKIARNGAVVSEYPLGYPALRMNFAARNRIISGLAKAVLVVEGAEKSGTLLTASHAAGQGRQVFAVPGQITSPLSFAPHFLIRNGVKIAFDSRDLLEELDIQFRVDRDKVEALFPADEEEKKILLTLFAEPLHLDEIARISGLTVAEVSGKLMMMELKGLVKSLGGGVYRKIS